MKIMILAALLATTMQAGDWKTKLLRVSQGLYLATTAADMGSSVGKYESNPMLRSGNGQFGVRGATFKLGIAGGMLTAEYFILRRGGQRATLPIATANLIYTAVGARVVTHNMGVRRVAGR